MIRTSPVPSLRQFVLQPIFFGPLAVILGTLAISLLVTRPRREGRSEPVPSLAGPAAARRLGKPGKGPQPAAVPDTTFADVAGLGEAVAELQELCDFIADPARFRALGGSLPRGVLLAGPPGTGKTLLTRALAGEAGIPLYSASASSFVEVYVGVGASRVRELFAQAKKHAPAIIFLDELDAVGRARSSHAGGGHEERESTLNQLLVEMDGFDPHLGVIVVAATNRADLLDPALLRRGRFDRHITVGAPDLEGRRSILAVHSRNKPLARRGDLEMLARRTPGFTGADLASVMNEAALLAARGRKTAIGTEELEEAIDRVVAGPARRTRVISDREKEIIAYHEGGHAVVATALSHTDEVQKVSIVSRGQVHGFTMTSPTEDRVLVTRNQLLDQLAVLLGGRVAEELVFADPTTGAQDDLERATAIAHQMVASYGMSDLVGLLSLGGGRGLSEAFQGDAVVAEIDSEVRRLLDEARAVATDIIRTHRRQLDELVRRLVISETLERDEIAQILSPARAA